LDEIGGEVSASEVSASNETMPTDISADSAPDLTQDASQLTPDQNGWGESASVSR
jgi:hypothetical protein